jgi:hypothetical protein
MWTCAQRTGLQLCLFVCDAVVADVLKSASQPRHQPHWQHPGGLAFVGVESAVVLAWLGSWRAGNSEVLSKRGGIAHATLLAHLPPLLMCVR